MSRRARCLFFAVFSVLALRGEANEEHPFAWLAGHWVGEGLGGMVEEVWSPPRGGVMFGMFRLMNAGETKLYELVTIAEGKDGWEMRLRHFHADLSAWEEKDGMLVWPLANRGAQLAQFGPVTYELEGEGRLRATVEIASQGAMELVFERAGAVAVEGLVAANQRHVFVSHELVNLHHFLYEWARLKAPGRAEDRAVAEAADVEKLSEEDFASWRDALAIYSDVATDKDLLFNLSLQAFRDRLLVDALDGEPANELEAALLEALELALPVYRKHWWSRHDEVNRAWAAKAMPLLDRYAEKLMERMAEQFCGTWPDVPIRVDLTAYANWAGAYTSWDPTHCTISTLDEDNQGYSALEVVLHESGHHEGLMRPLSAALDAAFRAKAPRDLWHVILFDSVGHEVQLTLAADGIEYEPFGLRLGVYRRGPWQRMHPAVARHWRPYVEGKAELGPTLGALAATLSQ